MDLMLIKAAMFTPTPKGWGLPMLFWGESGVGKSDVIEEFGAQWKMPVVVLCPGESGEGAFGMTPVPRDRDGVIRMTYPAPDWIDVFEDSDGRGIVFCDELTTAPPNIQAAELGLINSRRIGGAQLPGGVRVVAAANPPEKASNGWELTAPLANRLGHVAWDSPTEDEWGQHMLGSTGLPTKPATHNDPKVEEARVLKLWGGAWAQATGLITAFHARNRGVLHKQPDPGDPKAGRAWPSHRTWARATAAMASAKVHGLGERGEIEFVQHFVGEGATRQLLAFKQAMDLPDPALVLDGKVTWEHDPDRIDRSMAVLNTLAAYALSLKLDASTLGKDARIKRMWTVFEKTPADDVVAMAMVPLAKARYTATPDAINVMARLRPMLKAAGLVT